MRQFCLLTLVFALTAMPLLYAVEEDLENDEDSWSRSSDDWHNKYGSKRIQVKRVKAESPAEIYELKRASAKSTLDAEEKRCKYKEGTAKQYCSRVAEEKFNQTVARLRAERDAAQEKAPGTDP